MTETSVGEVIEPSSNAGQLSERRRLGVPAVTLMIIAASAPLTVIGGGVTTTFAVSGSLGVPFGFLVLAAVLLVFAVGYAAMSRFITNAGAFYAYVARGISPAVGIGSSLIALVCYSAMQVGVFAAFGFTVSDWLTTRFDVATPWYMWVAVGIVIVGILGVNRVDLSAKVLGTLVLLEFVAVLVFDIAGFIAQPEGVSLQPVGPSSLFASGTGAVLCFGIAAFMGFESAAIYAEEARRPEHTIPRATYLAVLIAGGFYALSSWAMVVAFGPGTVIEQSQKLGPGLLFAFLSERVGTVAADIVHILLITSLFAALQSFHNATARYFFVLGREGVLPRWLGLVRTSSRAPWAGSISQTAIAIVVSVVFVIAGASSDDPLYPVLTMFTWLANTGALGLVLLMTLVSLAVIGFFHRDQRGVSLWARLIAPAISAGLMTALLLLILANFNVLLGQTEANALTWIPPAAVVIPGVVGVLVGVTMKRRRPADYARVGRGSVSEEPPAMDARAVGI